MGMAGKTYAASNTDRLKSIPLGSGNVYFLPYVEGSAMPTDAQFELPANMVARTKNGATFTYTPTIYTAKSDDGIAKKSVVTDEQATFQWGNITWVLDTLSMFMRTASTSTVTENGVSSRVLEGGGIGNQVSKKYWFHFVGGDTIDGKFTITGVGQNIDALSAAFANDNETVLTPNFEFDPYDASGHLYKFKMANQPNVTSEAGTPKLSALALGSLTLEPTFDADVNEYTTTTENATNTVTATAEAGTDIVITVNGNSLTNGSAATWDTGENIVSIQLASATGMNTYTVTVTK